MSLSNLPTIVVLGLDGWGEACNALDSAIYCECPQKENRLPSIDSAETEIRLLLHSLLVILRIPALSVFQPPTACISIEGAQSNWGPNGQGVWRF